MNGEHKKTAVVCRPVSGGAENGGHAIPMSLSSAAFYTVQEVATIFRVPKSTVYEACKRSTIPSTRLGKHVRIPAWFVKGKIERTEREDTTK